MNSVSSSLSTFPTKQQLPQPDDEKAEDTPLWLERLIDAYFRRLPPSYPSSSYSGASLDRSALLNITLGTYVARLLESARGLLAGIAPLHRSIDHCRLCISLTDETAGKALKKCLSEAQNRTVELVRALEKVEDRRDGSERLEDVSHPNTLTAPVTSTSFSPSSSRATHWTTASPTGSPANAPASVDSAVLDELADRCANATTSYRSLLRELRPHLSRLGRHLDPRRLRSLLLTTHGAAAELSEAWTLLASVLAEPRPVSQAGPQLRQGRSHGQPSPFSNRSGPPTPRSNAGETEQGICAGTGPLRKTVASNPSSPPSSSPSSSSSRKAIAPACFSTAAETGSPNHGRNRGIPDSRVRSAAETAVVVANRVLALLLEDMGKGYCSEAEENPTTGVSPDPVVGFGKQVPVARRATTNLASALEAMASVETNAGIAAGVTPSECDVGKRTAAGGRVMEEAEEFVKSVIYLSTLAKEATTHRKDHPLSQTILSGIGMVTRSTKELALALQGPSVGKKSNEAGVDGSGAVRL